MILDTQNQSENTKDKTKCKAGLGCHNKCLEKEDKNSTDILLDIKYVRNILKDDKRFNETFELINPIKAGSGGAVHKIKHIKSQKPFAMKIMNKRNAKNKEALIHAKLKHQKIPSFFGFFPLGKNNSFITMEYTKFGDLENFKNNSLKRRCLSESLINYITGNLVEGLYYLHKNHIIHLDIKQQNVLVDELLNFKITDFSVSIKYDPKKKSIKLPLVGTNYYMSPEVLGRKTISVSEASKIDIYSLGVLLYFLAFNAYPYDLDNVDYDNYEEIRKNIEEKELVFPENSYSELFLNFLRKCLEKDIKKRYNIYQVMNDTWFKGHQILLDEKENLFNAVKFMTEMQVDSIKLFNDYVKPKKNFDI